MTDQVDRVPSADMAMEPERWQMGLGNHSLWVYRPKQSLERKGDQSMSPWSKPGFSDPNEQFPIPDFSGPNDHGPNLVLLVRMTMAPIWLFMSK
jgi:hypothetical protein